jgi:peroxiredoxin Q/BCP
MSLVGKMPPRFSLLDQDGKAVTPSQWKGSPVVLYFYPKDDTPTCTKQACGFRDAITQYESLGARVVGISPDTSKSHRKFATKYALPFTLLADPDHKVSEAYGVWQEKSTFGRTYMGVRRTTFVLDSAGKVRRVIPVDRVDGHVEEVLAAIRELQTDRQAQAARE